MEETKDQDQSGTPVETISNEQPATEQSETTKSETPEESLFELPDGRKVDASTLSKEWKENFYPEFTRRSQQLADIKRQEAETEARNKRTAEESLSKSTLLENVDPTVKEAIIELTRPEIYKALELRDKQELEKRNNEESLKELDALEKKYPGKFNKIEILRKMQDPANRIYDPEVLYQKEHWSDYIDEQIKAAMKGKSGGVNTESTSTEAPKAPGETTPAKSFSEATKRAMSRI